MRKFRQVFFKALVCWAVLAATPGARADSPTEGDFLVCLSVVSKAQGMIGAVQEYGMHGSQLWGYEPARIMETLEKYRFEASFFLLLERYENGEVYGDEPYHLIVSKLNAQVNEPTSEYVAQVIEKARAADNPVAEVGAVAHAHLGRDIWKCESAVYGLRYKIEEHPKIRKALEDSMIKARMAFKASPPVSIAN